MLRACLLWLTSLVFACALQTAFAQEKILNFHSDIQVLADSSMTVTETIRIRAEGDKIRRGIYRDFPTDYRDRWNNKIRVDFIVEGVSRDGSNEPFFTEKYANGTRLYIGRDDKFLKPGEYEYAIAYRTSRQLGYFDDHDELYWNVTGNGWDFAINSASATIKLPAGVPAKAMSIEGYTGPFGAKRQDYRASVTDDSEAKISATGSLPPGHGLTVVLSWPKGVVSEPTKTERTTQLLKDNRGLLVTLTGLVLMAVYLYFVWNRYGRDPGPGPKFPHYAPPDDLSPGACRYILNMSHDKQGFSAAVLSLAAKGYITIHEGHNDALRAAAGDALYDKSLDQLREKFKDRDSLANRLIGPLVDLAENAIDAIYDDVFVLEKNVESEELPALGPGEEVVLGNLFVAGNYLQLTQDKHETVRAAIKAHDSALKSHYRKTNFLTNFGLILPAAIIGFVTFLIALALAPLTPAAVATLLVAVGLIFLSVRLMKAPTTKGRKTMDQIEGFRMYLEVAEADELKQIEGLAGPTPEKSPDLFERFLPYAVALGVEQPWADQFEQLFARIAADQQQSYRPTWYRGNKPIHSFGQFAADMSGTLGNAISSASQAPGSSSGSGGGGSSGGGGGGGGGGGW